MTGPSRFVAWEGRSPLTGDPVVLVVTSGSTNVKTGPMWQAWLLHATVAPFAAVKSGQDAAVCGGCIRRGGDAGKARTCYVSLYTGPTQIYRTYRAGGYPVLTPREVAEALRGRHVRVTAYGDPVILPFAFWLSALQHAAGWVGYSHLWRIADQRHAKLFMASCDTPQEQATAAAMGWRTFRVRAAHDPVFASEFVCPASDEGHHRTTCQRCQLCRGTSSPAKSVVIIAHGRKISTVGRRGLYGEIRSTLERGEAATITETPRGLARIILALRQSYRRRGDTRSVRQHQVEPGRYEVRLS